ncbi:MAG: 2-dehydropantoate 2-reductase [Candidatus Lokiarchaeota archaeon]|nr:2-dehydropantoate 2-reductase [Candidatus Lokiarchaeota archaeon]MBD3200201.1 2-dehydropantoate 2-reductase [Candidatus Lokiarchaeota archaeon]
MDKIPKIIIYGAGAIGGTLGGFLSNKFDNIFLLARGEHAKVMKEKGLILYEMDPEQKKHIDVNVIESLDEESDADVIIIVVKNYNLEEVAEDIKNKATNNPVIMSFQNGAENQKILPKYIKKIIFGVLWFGAWRDKPGVIGCEPTRPITMGILNDDSEAKETMSKINNIFQQADIESEIVENFQDAVHAKIIFNITNALLTLIGHGFRDIENISKLRKITVNLLTEGIDIVKAAGYNEFIRGENHPTWRLLKIAKHLPGFITNKIFLNFINNVNLNSMAQDVITIQRDQTELDSINGYLLKLAEKHGIDAPYNRALYRACKEKFSEPEFKPMTEEELWMKTKEILKNKQ